MHFLVCRLASGSLTGKHIQGFVKCANTFAKFAVHFPPMKYDFHISLHNPAKRYFYVSIDASNDPDVKKLGGLMGVLLEDMQPPTEYTCDKLNRYCLFTEKGFAEKAMFF